MEGTSSSMLSMYISTELEDMNVFHVYDVVLGARSTDF